MDASDHSSVDLEDANETRGEGGGVAIGERDDNDGNDDGMATDTDNDEDGDEDDDEEDNRSRDSDYDELSRWHRHREERRQQREEPIPTPEEVVLEYTFPQDFVGKSWEEVVPRRPFRLIRRYFRLIIDPSCIAIPNNFFRFCTYVIDIVYPEGTDSKLLRIGCLAFDGCSYLQRMNKFPDGLVRLGISSFDCCRKLQGRITIPSSIRSVGKSCFSNCESITSVVFEPSTSTTTIVVELKRDIFWSCKKLRSVRLPNNLTVIPEGCFCFCYSLLDVVIPGRVRTIQSLAFLHCIALGEVDLPESVIVIGEEAFDSCSVLVSVTIRSSTNAVQVERNVFGACPSLETIRVVNPLIWSQVLSAMNTDPSFLYRFVRKYEDQIMTHHRSSR